MRAAAHRNARDRAFTLAELLVVLTVGTIVLGAAGAIVAQTAAARARIETQTEWQQEANAAMRAIATALRNAYRPAGGNEQMLFEGMDDRAGEHPSDRVALRAYSRVPVRAGEPESDMREVELFLEEVSDSPWPALLRRTDPTRNEGKDGGGVVERIANGVVGMDLTYHDGVRWLSRWRREWKAWPRIVRVEVTVVTDTERRTTRTLHRLISFPHRRVEGKD